MDDVLSTLELLEEMDDILFSIDENEENNNSLETQGNDGDNDGQ